MFKSSGAVVVFFGFLSLISFGANAMDDPHPVLLEATYHQVNGTDREYGQGAIERNELRHREIAPSVWLILVDAPGDTEVWRERLNAAVHKKHGAFSVRRASEEQERKVASGEIVLQK
ncbi:MAG TPA: hypothetical protein VEZ11_12960 [Thermoanaerobaculia bacterium]|nr:hypothetical protein [Thermoanaerobaculia bacterium]